MTTEEIMLRASAEPIICNIIKGLKLGNDCSIRNSIELGLRFAQNDIQDRFFCFLKSIFEDHENYYCSIVKYASENVDYSILKTLALNVGISSISCQPTTHTVAEIPPPITLDYDSTLGKILGYKANGAFIFIFDEIQNLEELVNCIHVAKKFPYSTFIFKCYINSIDKPYLDQIKTCKNIILAVSLNDQNKKADLFPMLRENNLLYGYYKNYEYVNDNDNENVSVLENANLGCCFGIYTNNSENNDSLCEQLKKNCTFPILLDDYDLLKLKFENAFAY